MKLNRKNKLLLVGLAITLYLCYALAFSNTLDYYYTYQSQKEQAATNLNDPALLQQLTNKEQQLDNALQQYSVATGDFFQNELLKHLTYLGRKNNLKIIDFKEPHNLIDKNNKTRSYEFSLQGSFNGILLLLNSLENNRAMGYIKHIDFIKKRNYKTNSDYLIAQIILQKKETAKAK